MAKRRSEGSGPTILILGVLGLGAWYLWGRKGTQLTAQPLPAATDASTAPPGPAVRNLTALANPVGVASDPNSIAYACNAAWRLGALGHPAQAAPWISKCTAGGGTVPTSANSQYR